MINRHALFVLLASASLSGCGSENAGDPAATASSAAALMYMQLALEEMPADDSR